MFFQEIDKMIAAGQSITITIHKTSVNMTASILPQDSDVNDEAVKLLRPLRITGTALELDEGFIETVKEPMQSTSGLLSSMKEYESINAEAEKNSKASKNKAENIGKFIKTAEKYEEENKFAEALAEYKKVLEIEPSHSKSTKKVAELEEKVNQGDLFAQ